MERRRPTRAREFRQTFLGARRRRRGAALRLLLDGLKVCECASQNRLPAVCGPVVEGLDRDVDELVALVVLRKLLHALVVALRVGELCADRERVLGAVEEPDVVGSLALGRRERRKLGLHRKDGLAALQEDERGPLGLRAAECLQRDLPDHLRLVARRGRAGVGRGARILGRAVVIAAEDARDGEDPDDDSGQHQRADARADQAPPAQRVLRLGGEVGLVGTLLGLLPSAVAVTVLLAIALADARGLRLGALLALAVRDGHPGTCAVAAAATAALVGLRDRGTVAVAVQRLERVEQRERPGPGRLRATKVRLRGRGLGPGL